MTLVDAFIFDMDGLLLDSEPLWRLAEIAALEPLGMPIDDNAARETTGLRVDEVVEHWHRQYPWDEPSKSAVAATIVEEVIALIRANAKPMPGVMDTLQSLSEAGYPLAVASSSSSEVIGAALDALGITTLFQVIQSAEHEPYGKPHPAVYIEAARRLGAPPTRCVAFEDSPNGVIAAKAARMRCIAVPDRGLRGDHRICAADAVLDSLTEFRLDALPELLNQTATRSAPGQLDAVSGRD